MEIIVVLIFGIITFVIGAFFVYKLIKFMNRHMESEYKKLDLYKKEKLQEMNISLNALNSRLATKNILNSYKRIMKLMDNLIQNEEVLYWTKISNIDIGEYVYITNKRIILIKIDNVKFIMIEKINSIKKNGNFNIEISDNFEITNIRCIYEEDRNKLVEKIIEEMDKHKNISININQTAEKDVLDKIAKLEVLYKEGILTEFEFNMKKMQLLDKMK